MRFSSSHLLIAFAISLRPCICFSVTTTDDADALANAIFGNGLTILQAQFSGASGSSGTFADGPFGIGSGGMLTSGAAIGALPNGDHYVDNNAPGSDTYCGVNTYNAAILTVELLLSPTFHGINFEYIMASEEQGGSADPIGIFVYGRQFATDEDGNRLTAASRYLAQPIGIRPPNSITSYPDNHVDNYIGRIYHSYINNHHGLNPDNHPDTHKNDFDYDEHNSNNNRVNDNLRANHGHNFLYYHFGEMW